MEAAAPCLLSVAAAVAVACATGAPAARQPAEPTAASEPCAPEECGPTPPTSPWLCADGQVTGVTGRCLRDDGGRCRWEIRECRDLVSCGGAGGFGCPAGFQCLDDPRDDCDPSERGSICDGLCARR
jgi:hypothetical protein